MSTQQTASHFNSASQPNHGHLVQLGLGFWSARAFLSAVELDVFSVLAAGALTEGQLRERLKLHPRASRDSFDTLVALQVLRRADGKYSNTKETDSLLDRAKPGYIGGLFELAAQRLYPLWTHLTEGLRTGQAQNEAKAGGDVFAHIYSNPESLRTFLSSMTGANIGTGRALAARLPWQDCESFVDVGGAQGAIAAQVALAHPHLHGVVFDLPALPEGAALIVLDSMIDDERSRNATGLLMSLCMLLETPGGFDYTQADCKGWLESTGFRDLVAEPLGPIDSMIIARK